jgi:hypothetical protein
MIVSNRKCAVCGVRDILRRADWPWWINGKPVHEACLISVASRSMDMVKLVSEHRIPGRNK